MGRAVITHRGITIYSSRTVLCVPEELRAGREWYEAHVDGWLVVGTLEGLCEYIDRALAPEPQGGGATTESSPPRV